MVLIKHNACTEGRINIRFLDVSEIDFILHRVCESLRCSSTYSKTTKINHFYSVRLKLLHFWVPEIEFFIHRPVWKSLCCSCTLAQKTQINCVWLVGKNYKQNTVGPQLLDFQKCKKSLTLNINLPCHNNQLWEITYRRRFV